MAKVNLNERLGPSKHSSGKEDGINQQKKGLFSKRKEVPLPQYEPPQRDEKDEQLLDEELLNQEAIRLHKEEKQERRRERLHKILTIVILISCIYIVFLIYGLLNTNYVYDGNGNVVAQIMSVDQIRQLEDYNKLLAQYHQARALYERVLVVDYRIAAGEEDPLLVAPEYENILDDVELLVIQLEALELPSEYTQTLDMLTSWTQNDIAIYCQNASRAVSQNNAEYAANAEEYQSIMYNDFSIITQNIVSLGSVVEGADIQDVIEWSPENYVQNEIGGVLK